MLTQDGNFFVLTDKGESVLDGKRVGFAFESSHLGDLVLFFWRNSTGKFDTSQPKHELKNGKYYTKLLPIEERYSGRFHKVEYIFKEIEKEACNKVEMMWYHEIDSWPKWKDFLASKDSEILKYPKLKLLNAGKWSKIAYDEEE